MPRYKAIIYRPVKLYDKVSVEIDADSEEDARDKIENGYDYENDKVIRFETGTGTIDENPTVDEVHEI